MEFWKRILPSISSTERWIIRRALGQNLGTAILVSGIVISICFGLGLVYAVNVFPRPVTTIYIEEPTHIVFEDMTGAEFVTTGYAIGRPYFVVTNSGHPVVNRGFMTIAGIDLFTVAVDPNVIPLGSILYVDSVGFAMAADTGKKIRGAQIDICFSSIDKAVAWGAKSVKVWMIRRGDSGS